MTHDKDFDKLISTFDRHQKWRVFADFVVMAAQAMRAPFLKLTDPPLYESEERRYLSIVGRYSKDEARHFAEAFAIVVDALEADMAQDFLGSAFMRLELSSHWHGQFFTPMSVCKMMGRLTVSPEIPERGYFTAMDPAVGAGAMLIALADSLREKEMDPGRVMYFHAVDIDETAAMMAYVQLSLIGLAGAVFIGNSLADPALLREPWFTARHYAEFWPLRLQRTRLSERPEPAPIIEQPKEEPVPAKRIQLNLF